MTDKTIFLETFSRLQPLAALNPDSQRELINQSSFEHFERNQDPFHDKRPSGQSAYLLRGELKLGYADGSSDVIVGGAGLALYPIGKRPPEIASAKAITDIDLVRINDKLLDIIMTWDQMALQADVQTSTRGAKQAMPDWRTLTGVNAGQNFANGAFAALPPAHIETLLKKFETVIVKRGEVIIREGGVGDFYYVIKSGRCKVTRRMGGDEIELAELKAGDVFGEEALVAETTRNATVIMITDGSLLRLGKTDFIALMREPLLHGVSPESAQEKAAAGAIWLDVRFPAEFQFDGIAGAINIPLSEIRNAFGALDLSKEYLVYCQSGRRSSAAVFLLAQRGFQTCLLEGGIWPTVEPMGLEVEP